ncbi:MAG: hypothetical protein ACRDLV_05420 [Solirubrobacteraceae bacterium]
MTPARPVVPRTSGRALVRLRSGQAYRAELTIAGGLIHAVEVEQTIGGYRRRMADRAWPHGALLEVRWIDDREAA